MRNKEVSSESDLDSDKSAREKLRRKFAREFKQNKNSTSDFSESYLLEFGAKSKTDIVDTMKHLNFDLQVRCIGIKLLIEDFTGPELDEYPAEIQRQLRINMGIVASLRDDAFERIDEIKKQVSTTSSNSSPDSVPGQLTGGQGSNNSRSEYSPSPRKKSRRGPTFVPYSMEASLLGLADCVRKIRKTQKFIFYSKLEDLGHLNEVSGLLKKMADTLRDTLGIANTKYGSFLKKIKP